VIFQVAGSDLVQPLENEPAVLEGIDDAQADWICRTRYAKGQQKGKCDGPAIAWFQDASVQDVLLASSGPRAWQRVDPDRPEPKARRVPEPKVTSLRVGTDTIAFEVDRVGSPVLVKTSFFPNWRVTGADGPYRVAPNFMVVVPTSNRVELTYGREPVEWVAYALSALGVALAVLLATRPPVRSRRRTDEAAATGPTAGPGPRHLAR